MAFEWDPDKEAANFRKHGVQFATEAVAAFDDDYAVIIREDESDQNERRFVLLAMSIQARAIIVVYTYRGDNIRIISARLATPHERAQYEAQL